MSLLNTLVSASMEADDDFAVPPVGAANPAPPPTIRTRLVADAIAATEYEVERRADVVMLSLDASVGDVHASTHFLATLVEGTIAFSDDDASVSPSSDVVAPTAEVSRRIRAAIADAAEDEAMQIVDNLTSGALASTNDAELAYATAPSASLMESIRRAVQDAEKEEASALLERMTKEWQKHERDAESASSSGATSDFTSCLDDDDESIPRRRNFASANVMRMDFGGQALNSALFRDAYCSEAVFDQAYLIGADFRRSMLRAARLRSAFVHYADFRGAILVDADFSGTDMRRAVFHVEDLVGAIWDQTTQWSSEVAEHISDTSVQVSPGTYQISEYSKVTFSMATSPLTATSVSQEGSAQRIDFASMELSGMDFSAVRLQAPDFRDTECVGTCFDGAYLGQAKFLRSNLLRSSFRGAIVDSADFRRANLAGADLRGTDMRRAIFDSQDLEGVVWDDTTQWPEEVKEGLRSTSVEVAPGKFEVSPAEPEGAGAAASRRR